MKYSTAYSSFYGRLGRYSPKMGICLTFFILNVKKRKDAMDI